MNRQEIVAEVVGEFPLKGMSHPITIYRVPIEQQKLSELPTKLLELVQQIAQGKPYVAGVGGNPAAVAPKPRSRVRRALVIGLCTVLALIVVRRVANRLRRTPHPVLHWIYMSKPDAMGAVARENWVGPAKVFMRLDSDSDGTITPDEVHVWAEREHVSLPLPPGQ